MKTIAVSEAKGILAGIRGLIGYPKAIPMLFRTGFGIHTFGLKFPIDVIVMNNQNQIVALKKNLTPLKIFLWNPRYVTVIELPAGSVNKLNLSPGEIINIKYA